MSLTLLPDAIAAGLCTGAVYGIVALGYNLVYSATGILNLAQGDLVMAAMMLTWLCVTVWHLPFVVTFVLVLVAVVAISAVEERFVVRPFLGRGDGNIGWFISTIGFSIVVLGVVSVLFGDHPIVPIPSFLSGVGFEVLGVLLVPVQLLVLGALIVLLVALELFLKYTVMGLRMRGTAEDREAVGLRGVDPVAVSRLAFVLGGVIAAVGGFVVGPLVATDVSVGLVLSVKGFIALAIGGFGNLRAGVAAALFLGVAEQVFDLYVNAQYELVVGLVLLLAVLTLKPAGFSVAARRV